MPHLVLLYTPNLEAETDMTALCRTLAAGMLQPVSYTHLTLPTNREV